MAEKYVNYVNLADGTDLFDLRHDSVKPEFLLLGETAHDATGKPIIGTLIPKESNIIDSGQCGENVFWELYENGLLVISGSGAIYDYKGIPANKSPFQARTDIVDVVIKDGITTIGGFLFMQSSVESVLIPDSVERIGEGAFSVCENLKTIIIPSSCTKIESATFVLCDSLSKVIIPDTITEIKSGAFTITGTPLDIFYTGTKEQWDNIAISENSNDRLFTATLHCEYEEVIPKEEQEVTYPTITENGTYEILPEEGKVMSKATVEVDVKNADTIDGWHLDVRLDGSDPPEGITNTISLIFTVGG